MTPQKSTEKPNQFVFVRLVPITSISWEKYRADCGYDAYQMNPRKAKQRFELGYRGRGVSWDGYVVRVSLSDEEPLL